MGLYYLQSRYYNPTIGRFLNADALISTGQGVLGNNMFAYCRNNPVTRVDFSGTWDVDCFDSDGNPITDEKEMWGRSSTGGGTGTPSAGQNNSGGSKGGGGSSAQTQTAPSAVGGNPAAVGSPNDGKIEVHHIVEQCQVKKSGFSRENIDGASNKIGIPKSVHQKISGHYSSKTELSGNLRVRDWLAGKSFEFQTCYGWMILEQMWMEVFG